MEETRPMLICLSGEVSRTRETTRCSREQLQPCYLPASLRNISRVLGNRWIEERNIDGARNGVKKGKSQNTCEGRQGSQSKTLLYMHYKILGSLLVMEGDE